MSEDERADPSEAAEDRQHERTEGVEETLAAIREDLGNQKYPATSEELAATYADQAIDLPNETESIGSVFDRIENSFEDSQAAYEAFLDGVGLDPHRYRRMDSKGPEPPSWGEGRAETQQPASEDEPVVEGTESTVKTSRDHAREAMVEAEADEAESSGDEARAEDRDDEPRRETGADSDA